MSQIYLISPPEIELNIFSKKLESLLKTGLIPVFQMRLKNLEKGKIVKNAKELKKICQDNNCQFLINDSLEIALEVGASGVHLGKDDGSILQAREKYPKDFIIGDSCYNQRNLAIEAAEQGANYLAFGAFFETKTKEVKYRATTEILDWANEILDLPIVAIGGITSKNCSSLIKSQADFLAVISEIWNHPQGEKIALENFRNAILNQKNK